MVPERSLRCDVMSRVVELLGKQENSQWKIYRILGCHVSIVNLTNIDLMSRLWEKKGKETNSELFVLLGKVLIKFYRHM